MHGRLIFGNVERGDHPLEEAFFKTISPPLEDFARHHSLIIWKYPRHAPQWIFHFLHPLGGFASVTLNCDSVGKPPRIRAAIQGQWYVDDHEQAIRRVSSLATLREVPPASEQIIAGLEDILSTVTAWPRSVLTVSPLDVSPQEIADSKVLRSEFELSLRLPT